LLRAARKQQPPHERREGIRPKRLLKAPGSGPVFFRGRKMTFRCAAPRPGRQCVVQSCAGNTETFPRNSNWKTRFLVAPSGLLVLQIEALGARSRAPKDPGILPLAMHDIFQAHAFGSLASGRGQDKRGLRGRAADPLRVAILLDTRTMWPQSAMRADGAESRHVCDGIMFVLTPSGGCRLGRVSGARFSQESGRTMSEGGCFCSRLRAPAVRSSCALEMVSGKGTISCVWLSCGKH